MTDYRAPPRIVLLVAALIVAADTVRVDSTVTPGSAAGSDPRTCGFIRTSARWR